MASSPRCNMAAVFFLVLTALIEIFPSTFKAQCKVRGEAHAQGLQDVPRLIPPDSQHFYVKNDLKLGSTQNGNYVVVTKEFKGSKKRMFHMDAREKVDSKSIASPSVPEIISHVYRHPVEAEMLQHHRTHNKMSGHSSSLQTSIPIVNTRISKQTDEQGQQRVSSPSQVVSQSDTTLVQTRFATSENWPSGRDNVKGEHKTHRSSGNFVPVSSHDKSQFSGDKSTRLKPDRVAKKSFQGIPRKRSSLHSSADDTLGGHKLLREILEEQSFDSTFDSSSANVEHQQQTRFPSPSAPDQSIDGNTQLTVNSSDASKTRRVVSSRKPQKHESDDSPLVEFVVEKDSQDSSKSEPLVYRHRTLKQIPESSNNIDTDKSVDRESPVQGLVINYSDSLVRGDRSQIRYASFQFHARHRRASQRGRRPNFRFPSRSRTTSSPLGEDRQQVSFKVIMHLSFSRGYDRHFNLVLKRERKRLLFRSVSRYIDPVGTLVLLDKDEPRTILEAFCKKILHSNTTAVLHIFNPFDHARSWHAAQYVSNLLSTVHIPVISWGPEYTGKTVKKDSDSLELQLSPTVGDQAQAMIGILKYYNWTQFAVVYTPVAGFDAFISAIRNVKDISNAKTRSLESRLNVLAEVEISDSSNEERTLHELEGLVKSDTRIILLYGLHVDALNIFSQATRLGLMSNEFVWILSFEAVNKDSRSEANSLPLGLLGIQYDYGDQTMKSVMETGVKIWFRSLREALKMGDTNDKQDPVFPWKLPNLECSSGRDLKWTSGQNFYELLKNVSYNSIQFTDTGQLKYKNLTIINVQSSYLGSPTRQWEKVGTWTKSGLTMQRIWWPGGSTVPPRGKPGRHFVRIVTREEPPFVEFRHMHDNGTCDLFSTPCQVYEKDENASRVSNQTVGRCCTGLSIDFLLKLSDALEFDYYLYEVGDLQWGTKMENGEWNGIVGDLRSGKADMAVASMTVDEDKSTAINFSVPYMETGITFIVAMREGAISATAFLEPYDYPSWCLILVCSVHVTGASIFIFEWLSPNGMDHGKRMSNDHRFSLFRTFWLMWAMLFGAAVTTDTPRAVSSKFMTNIWALFALVFLASYTANLAAFMITKEEFYDLSGMHDWRLQYPNAMTPPFRFGTVPNSTAESNIKKNNPEMHRYMSKFSQSSTEQAMEALKSQVLHAFVYDASVLQYHEGKDKDCQLITVGSWYAATGYGVAFPFGSPWLERVNNKILDLQYQGEMERLKDFWLSGACHTKRKKNNDNRGLGNRVHSTTLGILNFTSAFIFLAAGTGLASIVFFLEHCFFWFGRKWLGACNKKGCCGLISLSMGMSLSFQDSVREAMDHQKKVAESKLCKRPACETKLWKANHELRQARQEIDQLQKELVRLTTTTDGSESSVWKLDPDRGAGARAEAKVEDQIVLETQGLECAKGQDEFCDDDDEENSVRVTLL